MGEVAIESLAARADHIRLFFAMSSTNFAFSSPARTARVPRANPGLQLHAPARPGLLSWLGSLERGSVPDVSILVVEDDISSQRAMRNVLDAEGWRVRIVPAPSQVMAELARGVWDLVIVNAAMIDPRGPLFAILRELTLADSEDDAEAETQSDGVKTDKPGLVGDDPKPAPPAHRRLRVLFLIPADSKDVQPIIEREGLPYTAKPYNLHEFLEKVSDLLIEGGAIDSPIRTIREFVTLRQRRAFRRPRRDSRSGAMFAPREDYQMTEEEMAEWERQEEEERKKRRKQQQEREHLG
jgi:CheY-like chemotaxis protein